MTRTTLWIAMAGCCLWAACDGDDKPSVPSDPDMGAGDSAPTYWGDVAPLFAERCMHCHREDGIAPFRLDDYGQAKSFSKLIEHVTRERIMPPWSVTSDGSCGEFADSEALEDDEIELIARWVEGGALEGTPRSIEVPNIPTLQNAREWKTPNFLPEIQGGELSASDEYRCFALDAPDDPRAFITGYEVVPGNPSIVHHVVVMLVDPNEQADFGESTGLTNAEQMRMLDDESPDRDGWPCFGMAGEGVAVAATPVVWAPGQGVVDFPEGSGVRLQPDYKVIIQVHYNLADERTRGQFDQTTVRLRIVPEVENVAIFALQDQLLGSLDSDEPVTLPPGKKSAVFAWSATARELGFEASVPAKLYGVMPHMHQLGRKYRLSLRERGESEQCAANVDNWDFHWQRMYFYEKPITLTGDTQISVMCDYDTSSVTEPVMPGWGTRNEMCLATLYITVPASALD